MEEKDQNLASKSSDQLPNGVSPSSGLPPIVLSQTTCAANAKATKLTFKVYATTHQSTSIVGGGVIPQMVNDNMDHLTLPQEAKSLCKSKR